jgi:hypothetical protein
MVQKLNLASLTAGIGETPNNFDLKSGFRMPKEGYFLDGLTLPGRKTVEKVCSNGVLTHRNESDDAPKGRSAFGEQLENAKSLS